MAHLDLKIWDVHSLSFQQVLEAQDVTAESRLLALQLVLGFLATGKGRGTGLKVMGSGCMVTDLERRRKRKFSNFAIFAIFAFLFVCLFTKYKQTSLKTKACTLIWDTHPRSPPSFSSIRLQTAVKFLFSSVPTTDYNRLVIPIWSDLFICQKNYNFYR